MRKVLLVEDDVYLRKLYKELIEAEGFFVFTARTKGEAFSLINDEDKDIGFVLLDYMLAENTSGMDLLEDMQKTITIRDINVVMLTNVVKPEERERALSLGAKDYLAKAKLDPKEVVQVVQKYIKPQE